MKICLIGPGIMPIPPIDSWGAVESLIWETAQELELLGQEVNIINTPNRNEILNIIAKNQYDFVHLHYDVFHDILDYIQNVDKIAISSAYPYVDQISKHWSDGYVPTFDFLIKNKKYYNFCLSDKDLKTFKKFGADTSMLYRFKTGASDRKFIYNEDCKLNRSIYLAKIEQRKKQWLYQSIESIDFAGRYTPVTPFDVNKNYLGEWTDEQKYNQLTNYANLILLSDGENGTPLVCKEALICGLGLVISEYASDEVDKNLPFITIIPHDKLLDIEYIEGKILENRTISMSMKKEIREYGVNNFSWTKLTQDYLNTIQKL